MKKNERSASSPPDNAGASPLQVISDNENNTAMSDLDYERYRRIVGLFDTVPSSPDESPAAAHARELFEKRRQEIESLIVDVKDSKGRISRQFRQDDASDYVHNLSLLLFQVLPIKLIEPLISSIREDFREAVGPEVYQRYCQSPSFRKLSKMKPDTPGYEASVRADATYVLNELRRQNLQQRAVEVTRKDLIRKLGTGFVRVGGFLGSLVILVFAGTVAHEFRWLNWLGKDLLDIVSATANALVLLSLAGISGAFGACLSAFIRIQGLGGNSQLGRSLAVLSYSATVLRYMALYGMAVAFLLGFLIAGGLVAGGFFPSPNEGDPWSILFNGQELAKWLFWTFFAGFSERFVPDLIGRVAAQARDESARASQVQESAPVAISESIPEEPAKTVSPESAPPEAVRPAKLAPPKIEWMNDGVARATWASFPDATRYIPQIKVSPRDAEYKPLAATRDTRVDVPDIPAGSSVSARIEVQSEDGSSILSDTSNLAARSPLTSPDEEPGEGDI